MRLFLFFFLFLISIVAVNAQQLNDIRLRATLSGGRIVKHSPKFKAPVRGNTLWSELNLERQTDGTQAWHHTHRLPTLGLSCSYANFGDPEVFGEAFGLMPNMTFGNRATTQKWYSFVRVGMGVAYLTRPFHAINNTENTVIGQNINNITDLRGGVGFWLAPHLDLSLGGSFTHYSDGASQLPNLGINVPAFFVGISYVPHRVLPINVAPKTDSTFSVAKRWHALVQLDYGIHEQIVEGGPKYFFAGGSLGAMYDLSPKHHIFSGFTYEFTENAYRFAHYHRTFGDDEDQYIWCASRFAWHIGDELQFGQFAFGVSLGFYLKNSVLPPLFFYEKLTWRYYLLSQKKALNTHVQPYVHIQLKAHLTVAEYFSVGAGAKF